MAKMNNDAVLINQETQIECGMFLQACLTKGELETLRHRWNEAGGIDNCHWWKFALENIKVSI